MNCPPQAPLEHVLCTIPIRWLGGGWEPHILTPQRVLHCEHCWWLHPTLLQVIVTPIQFLSFPQQWHIHHVSHEKNELVSIRDLNPVRDSGFDAYASGVSVSRVRGFEACIEARAGISRAVSVGEFWTPIAVGLVQRILRNIVR